MKRTPQHWEILRHRLEVPDAISDNFENEDGTYYILPEIVGSICDELIATMDESLTLPENPTSDCLDVLANAVEFSTYYACHTGHGLHPLKLEAIGRAGRALAKKVTQYIRKYHPEWQEELEYPCW